MTNDNSPSNDLRKFLGYLHHELKTCLGGMESAFGTLADGKGSAEMSKKLFQVSLTGMNQLLDEIEKRKVE